jgi:hypothetical protein
VTAPERPRFLDALEAVRAALDETGIPWTFIGGVAVIASGVPRQTADIDVTLLAGSITVAELIRRLGAHDLAPRIEDAELFAHENQVLLLEHSSSGVPVDLSLAWLPFEEEAIRASRLLDYAGVRIPIPRPEDIVVYKLIASRAHDLKDAERLYLLHRKTIDITRVRTVIAEVCLALEDQSRLEALDRLLDPG